MAEIHDSRLESTVLSQVEEDIKLCEGTCLLQVAKLSVLGAEYLARDKFAIEDPDWALNRRTFTDFGMICLYISI